MAPDKVVSNSSKGLLKKKHILWIRGVKHTDRRLELAHQPNRPGRWDHNQKVIFPLDYTVSVWLDCTAALVFHYTMVALQRGQAACKPKSFFISNKCLFCTFVSFTVYLKKKKQKSLYSISCLTRMLSLYCIICHTTQKRWHIIV